VQKRPGNTGLFLFDPIGFVMVIIMLQTVEPASADLFDAQPLLTSNELVYMVLAISLIFGLMLWRSYREKQRLKIAVHTLMEALSKKDAALALHLARLEEATGNVERLRQHIDEQIYERTAKLQQHSMKIVAYTRLNSYKLREPLARVLGLVMLMEREAMNDKLRDLFLKLNISANELDEIVQEFMSTINAEEQ